VLIIYFARGMGKMWTCGLADLRTGERVNCGPSLRTGSAYYPRELPVAIAPNFRQFSLPSQILWGRPSKNCTNIITPGLRHVIWLKICDDIPISPEVIDPGRWTMGEGYNTTASVWILQNQMLFCLVLSKGSAHFHTLHPSISQALLYISLIQSPH